MDRSGASLISAYFPHCGYGDAAVEQCYSITSELHEQACKQGRMTIKLLEAISMLKWERPQTTVTVTPVLDYKDTLTETPVAKLCEDGQLHKSYGLAIPTTTRLLKADGRIAAPVAVNA